jgi:hypothetical protein
LTDVGILPPIAAIGMSLAGFAGLIAALLKRGESWTPRDIFFVRQMVSYGFATVLFALLPIPLASVFGADLAFRGVSLALLLFAGVWGVIGGRVTRRLLHYPWRRRLPFTVLALIQLPLVLWSVLAARLDVYELALIFFLAYPMPIFFVTLTEIGGRPSDGHVEPPVPTD